MPDLLLNIVPGTISPDCYPSSADAFQKNLLLLARVVFPGQFTTVAIGASPPSDHAALWVRTDTSNNLIRFYTHGGYGVWNAPHPEPPGSSKRYLWVGTEADLVTFDEGTNVPVSDVTGPFWVVDHDFDFRTLFGPGTNPVAYPPNGATTINVGDTGGEELHSLTEQEMPPHKHQMTFQYEPQTGKDTQCLTNRFPPPSGAMTVSPDTSITGGNGATPSVVVPHNNMMPYRGIFVIRRTARIFYVV